jgi:hypothetical protein
MDSRSSKWEQALCVDWRDDTFFTDGEIGSHGKSALAIEVCKRPCPILEECLVYAIQNHPIDGIWGATTLTQRKELLKQRRTA